MQFHCLLSIHGFYCLFYCLLCILEAHRDADRVGTSGRMCVGVRVGGCITESSVYSSLCG